MCESRNINEIMINVARTVGRSIRILSVLILIPVCPFVIAAPVEHILEGFPPPQQDFDRHIAEVRDYLLVTQLRGRSPNDVEYNVPFELSANNEVPYRGRYLLIHGLNDSPAVWHDVALALSERGFDVRAILLPGHGNTPEAQLHVSWRQWLDAARLQLDYWHSADAPLYLGGFSLGGVLATILALENDEIDGLFLFAPAFQSSKIGLLRWASWVAPIKPWVFGGMIIEDNPTKYNSIPINAAAQYYKTSRYLQRHWHQQILSMPVLMIETMNDSVVDVQKTRHIFARRFSSPGRRLLLYSNDRIQAGSHEIIRPSAYPSLRILNQSHQGMMVSPENPLFGQDATQLVCNGNEWKIFSACLYYTEGPHWHGAEGTPSPDGVPVARTTFNPDFDGIMALHDQVFAVEPE